MRMHEAEKLPEALYMAEVTLKAMAEGGIFDQIGGGFSRYSTDQRWLAPHFEKMLYDNALLLLAYLEAFQLTQKAFYADVAKRTAGYILRELASPEGGFYCGQDADSDGVEGKYYVFTHDEIIQVLGEQDGKEFCRAYDITKRGNFEGQSIPNRIGKRDAAWGRVILVCSGFTRIGEREHTSILTTKSCCHGMHGQLFRWQEPRGFLIARVIWKPQ